MKRYRRKALLALVGLGLLASGPWSSSAAALPFTFSTGSPDGRMAMASRPASEGVFKSEAGDDFVLGDPTSLTGATFTGLLPSSAPLSSVERVRVEVYRVFPEDSDVTRTSGTPVFSTSLVPTRLDSPADVGFAQADSAAESLSFGASILGPTTVVNTLQNGGIHPKPNQTTGGNGAMSGEEVVFEAAFSPHVRLAAGRYYFVPQVALSSGDFLWLSAAGPLGSADLQAWARDANLAPDWLRLGTDIVGGGSPPKFNGSFALAGTRCQALSISPGTLPQTTVGSQYSASFTASGGVSPYGFSASGTLPGGVSLAPGGTLSGNPTNAGSFPIAVTATDADGCAGTADVTLTVHGSKSTTKPTDKSAGGPPDTRISRAKIASKGRRAKFKFTAIGSSTGFECALVKRHRKPKFRACRSPKAYRHLKLGVYTFEVRAIGSAGRDPTPAKRRFEIHSVT